MAGLSGRARYRPLLLDSRAETTTMNYWDYIRVEDLLRLQGGFDDDESKVSNDETLFIVVHQVYELWFKLVLRELTTARNVFQQNPVPDVELASAARGSWRALTFLAAGRDGSYVAGALRLALISGLPFASAET